MIYATVFPSGTLLRARLDAMVMGEMDPAPGTSNSAILEQTMVALVSGNPIPKDPYGGGLVPRIEAVFKELFDARDAGQFEKSQRRAA